MSAKRIAEGGTLSEQRKETRESSEPKIGLKKSGAPVAKPGEPAEARQEMKVVDPSRLPEGPESSKSDSAIILAIYESLRAEILEKMRFSYRLAGYKVLSVGTALGFLLSNKKDIDDERVFYSSPMLILALVLAFDIQLMSNNKSIIMVGCYIRECLEKAMKNLMVNKDLEMWEEYIGSPGKKRAVYNVFETTNYLISIAMMIAIGVWLFVSDYGELNLIVLVFGLAEAVLIWRGATRRTPGPECIEKGVADQVRS